MSNNGVVLREKGYLREIRLYVPSLWAPHRVMIVRQSTGWSNVSGPPEKVVAFAGKEICIYILEILNRYPGLWWQKAQVKLDANLTVKVAVEKFFNSHFPLLEKGWENGFDGFGITRDAS